MKYIKSPFNYIGNKYKLLAQILPLFPKNIDVFYDVFCGGLDVSINVEANTKYANDINHFVIEILELFKTSDYNVLIKDIYKIIDKFGLSKINKENYYKFRDYYNANKNPLLLYVLICFSFNYQFRFNSNHEYNNPAGTNRSHFNRNIEKRLELFMKKMSNIEFTSKNFIDLDYSHITTKDFVYFDPPYRSSVGSYNDGKRGFEGWNVNDDLRLFEIIDSLDKRGIKFALSNVFYNNGLTNVELKEWSKKYNIHYLEASYINSNYQRKKCDETKEVLITNY